MVKSLESGSYLESECLIDYLEAVMDSREAGELMMSIFKDVGSLPTAIETILKINAIKDPGKGALNEELQTFRGDVVGLYYVLGQLMEGTENSVGLPNVDTALGVTAVLEKELEERDQVGKAIDTLKEVLEPSKVVNREDK
ncbi:MAG TPA: hypothetical protein VLH19_02935 [Patescibacteria group bacterium]|nr:hypothetical protein [Patescibacteria group bacterium]